jgi:hypothetical protein
MKVAADRSLELFEAAGDERGQALAWSTRAFAQWFDEQVEDSRKSAEHALGHARAAGDRVTEGEILGLIMGCNALGPTPVDLGIAQGEEILADARKDGNRRLEQAVLRSVATMHSMKGSVELARELITVSRSLAQELGLTIEYWAAAQNAGRNEWLAGDLDAAANVIRDSCEALDALGEKAFLSTHATMLAELEVERGPSFGGRTLDRRRRTHGVARRSSDADRDPAGAGRRPRGTGRRFCGRPSPASARACRRDGHVSVPHRGAAATHNVAPGAGAR